VTHVLGGTRISSEEPCWAETVVNSTIAPAPAPVIKGKDISTILEKFVQMLVSAMTVKPNANILHTHMLGEINCHFCGGKGHILPNCPLVLKYINEGKICKNQEGCIVLSSGTYVPRSIPGRWILEQVDEWHRRNPGQTVEGQLSSNTGATMLFFEEQPVIRVTEQEAASILTLSAEDCIKALEHEIFVLCKQQIFDRVEIAKKAPVWKGKEPMRTEQVVPSESNPVTSSSKDPSKLHVILSHAVPSHSTPLQTVPSQAIPSQPVQAQPLMPAPQPVCIVQKRENTPPTVAEKEPPVHPFAGIPESNYVPPTIHNFTEPAEKNFIKDKEPAYKIFAPIQNMKVTDTIYERLMKAPSVMISPEELLSFLPEIWQKMHDAVTPKWVITGDVTESPVLVTHYNSKVPLPFIGEVIDPGPVCMGHGILPPAEIIPKDHTLPPFAIIIPDPYETYLNSLEPSTQPDVLTVAKELHAL